MAEQSGHAVEVTSLLTKETAVFANPDGTFTADLASGPVREP